LKFSVEKNFCVVLTGNDQERAQVVAGLRGRLIDRDFSGARVGRNARSRQGWFRSRLCRGGDDGSGHSGDGVGGRGDGRGRDGGSGGWRLRYWRSLMFSREEEDRCDQDDRGGGGDEDQRCGVRPRGLFCLG